MIRDIKKYKKISQLIEQEVIKRTHEEFLCGHTIKCDIQETDRYRGACFPNWPFRRRYIYLSKKWHDDFSESDEYWNSLLLSVGHELTHFDLYNMKITRKSIRELIRKVDPILGNKSKKGLIKFSNWLVEIYCDLYGAQRSGRTIGDLEKRISEFACKVEEDGSRYPSNDTRIELIKSGRFDSRLVRDIEKRVFGENKISENCINDILEMFEKCAIVNLNI